MLGTVTNLLLRVQIKTKEHLKYWKQKKKIEKVNKEDFITRLNLRNLFKRKHDYA